MKNFILLGDIHKSIYFLSWKEQGAQLTLLAKDFGSLDCFATEFLIDGSTLSLTVSDDQKNVQVSSCNYTSTRDVIGTLRWQAILTRIPIVLLCSRHTRYLCLHYKSLKNFSLLIVAYLLKSVYCLTPSLFHESEKGYPQGNNVKDMSLVTLGYF